MCLFSPLVFFVVENSRSFKFSTNSSSILQAYPRHWVSKVVLHAVSLMSTNMTFSKLKFTKTQEILKEYVIISPVLHFGHTYTYNKFQISLIFLTCWLIWKQSFYIRNVIVCDYFH